MVKRNIEFVEEPSATTIPAKRSLGTKQSGLPKALSDTTNAAPVDRVDRTRGQKHRGKGRPRSQCDDCRMLRQTQNLHLKCIHKNG
ncbi:hypothetical protein BC938DRAFT_471096 [Jimgerdemannia flammicorona]|uniref:Uncharacterized protein n=1 Tax=Jimgerdemannia flammicorona TaxID=994334 RepID=A0A433Q8U2_9FUNG|nr:hypothetical protein BC938DRAFT_471096 [Jimgerdemannia flammicorona]